LTVARGVLVLFAIAATWVVASSAPVAAASPCWQRLVHDWGDGRIDGVYSVSCYRQALASLPEDLQVYSSAPDDIEAALARKVHRSGNARTIQAAAPAARGSSSGGWLRALTIVLLAGGLSLGLAGALRYSARLGRTGRT
jgi:hypothetical protein